MIDPYDVLGVEQGADEPTIRKAYRERAKTAHPDAGGSDEEWEAVSRSLVVLTDPDPAVPHGGRGRPQGRRVPGRHGEALTLPDRAPEENTISRNFESQARQNRKIIEGLDKEAEIAGMAIEIVRGYRFAAEREPEFFTTSFGFQQPRVW